MTRTTPFRLIILHLSQIFFTEARTFIIKPHPIIFVKTKNTSSSASISQFLRMSRISILLISIGDPSSCQVIRRQLNSHFIAWEYSNEVFSHFSGDMGQHSMTILYLHSKHSIGQWLDNGPFDLNDILF